MSDLFSVRHELSVTNNGLLLRGTQIVMPSKLRRETLKHAHKGHQGIVKTKQALRTKVWWLKMEKDAKDYEQRCHACQCLGQADLPAPITFNQMPSKPWERLHMDFLGPDTTGETLLVVTDAYSKFPEVEIMKSTTTKQVITRLERIFATHGLPLEVRTDNGPPFNANVFHQYMKSRGIPYRTVTPLWPQANGEAESFMKPLNKAIRAAQLEGLDWREEIYTFLLAYRTAPQCSTGMAPAQLLFNREARIPMSPEKREVVCKELRNKAKENVEKKQHRAKTYIDKKRRAREPQISVGDTVLVRQQYRNKPTSLFDPKPLVVTAVNGTMLTASREDYLVTRNVSHFKKYFHSESDALKAKHACDGEDKDTDNGATGTCKQREASEARRYPLRSRNKPKYY